MTSIVQHNRPFPSCPGPLFQNKGRRSAFDMEIIFHSHANKTHFFSRERFCTYPHFESEGFWNSEVAYFKRTEQLIEKTWGRGCVVLLVSTKWRNISLASRARNGRP